MTVKHRGFIIEVLPEAGEFVCKCKRVDGSLIEHEDNPDYYDDEEDAINNGKRIIDEFLDE